MQKREKIIGIIMFIVIVIAALAYLPRPKKTSAALTKTAVSKAVSPAKVAGLERLIEQAKSDFTEPVLSSIQDPFMKQKPKRDRLGHSDLVLSGIIWGENRPIALINDKPLMEGETIADFKIEKITQEEVILARGAEKFSLKFPLGLRKGSK